MTDSSLTIITVLVVALVALAGGRFLLRTRAGRPQGFVPYSMAFYLVLGLAVGGEGLGLLDGKLLRNLEPVQEMALGWIGLLFGLQLGYRPLSRFPALFHRTVLFESTFTMALTGAALWFVLKGAGGGSGSGHREALLALAVLSGVSSPTATALAALAGGRARHRLARLAHYVTSLDPLAPLLVFTLGAGYFHPLGGGVPAALHWPAASLLLGLALGLLFNSFARHRHEERELTMLIIAFTVFAGGVATYLHLSSLFICVVMGTVLANLLPASEKIFRVLSSREKPILVLLLVLTGASWRIEEVEQLSLIWILLGVYLAARTAGKLGAMALVRLTARDDLERGAALGGLALLGQGGMSLALIANYQLLFGGPYAATAVTVGILALAAGELYSARAARAALFGGGDGEGGR